jgi:enoyl-CoA hydratase/carnithine racemase
VGHGRASELLFFGDIVGSKEALAMGLANRVVPDEEVLPLAMAWAEKLARGPAFAHTVTKQMLESEYSMSLPQAIEAEAQAQAICMAHPDFRIAYDANQVKEKPRFTGAEVCDAAVEATSTPRTAPTGTAPREGA